MSFETSMGLWAGAAALMLCMLAPGCDDGGANLGGTTVEDCAAGEDCDFVCRGGRCDLDCAAGSTCTARCNGGQCNFACAAGSTCEFNCLGGQCNFTCEDPTTCDLGCIGGQCNFDGTGGRDAGGGPGESVDTCADLCTFTGSANDDEIACVTQHMQQNGYAVTGSQTCLQITVEEQCNACAAEFSIAAEDCRGAYARCF